MKLLDEILLGRRRQNDTIRKLFTDDAVQNSERVSSLTPQMLITQRRSNDPATIGMATAMLRTTGVVPSEIGMRDHQVVPLPFEGNSDSLREMGIEEGMAIDEVYARLGGQRVNSRNIGSPLAGIFASMMGNGQAVSGNSRMSGVSTDGYRPSVTPARQATETGQLPNYGQRPRPASTEAERLFGEVPRQSASQTPLTFGSGSQSQSRVSALTELLRRYQ